MRPPPPSPPLVELLEQCGLGSILTADEQTALTRPEVSELSLAEQLEWLRANRKVGYFVTTFASGIRLVLFAGGALAALWLAVEELLREGRPDPFLTLVFGGLGLGLVGVSLWLGRAFVRRLRELRAPVPSPEEVGL